MGSGPYLRPLMAPLLGSDSPNADAMLAVLDTGFIAAQAALAQVKLDFDPRTATGDALVNMGLWGGVPKLAGDSDDDLRRRILAGPTPIPSSKGGIAQQVSALAGVPVVVQTVAPGLFTVTLFGNSARVSAVMPLVRRLKASGMQPRGQMVIPRPATAAFGVQRFGQPFGGAGRVITLPDPTAPAIVNIPVINTLQSAFRTNPHRTHALFGVARFGAVAFGQ